MKRFEFKVALHILIIFLLSIGSCLLYQRQLWFSTTVCILFLIGAGMHLYRIQFKLQRYDAESSSAFQK